MILAFGPGDRQGERARSFVMHEVAAVGTAWIWSICLQKCDFQPTAPADELALILIIVASVSPGGDSGDL